jgi:hypothetical protein
LSGSSSRRFWLSSDFLGGHGARLGLQVHRQIDGDLRHEHHDGDRDALQHHELEHALVDRASDHSFTTCFR